MSTRRLHRTKRWNFAGLLVTVSSSTLLYANAVAYFALSFSRQYSLGRSIYGNPFTFGLSADMILNTLGMILLCGMFKDTVVMRFSTLFSAGNTEVVPSTALNQRIQNQAGSEIPDFMSDFEPDSSGRDSETDTRVPSVAFST
jgi:hypothetical protein